MLERCGKSHVIKLWDANFVPSTNFAVILKDKISLEVARAPNKLLILECERGNAADKVDKRYLVRLLV